MIFCGVIKKRNVPITAETLYGNEYGWDYEELASTLKPILRSGNGIANREKLAKIDSEMSISCLNQQNINKLRKSHVY